MDALPVFALLIDELVHLLLSLSRGLPDALRSLIQDKETRADGLCVGFQMNGTDSL